MRLLRLWMLYAQMSGNKIKVELCVCTYPVDSSAGTDVLSVQSEAYEFTSAQELVRFMRDHGIYRCSSWPGYRANCWYDSKLISGVQKSIVRIECTNREWHKVWLINEDLERTNANISSLVD